MRISDVRSVVCSSDLEAVAAYAPFVDAMFIDKECALLLTQGRPGKELNFRVRIFSLTNRDEFLDYLSGLEAQADEKKSRHVQLIYGLEERKRVVTGKRVSVRVDLGGCRIPKKK